MVTADIIVPVTEPTQWISSTVVVPKENGSLRICLDPKDFESLTRVEIVADDFVVVVPVKPQHKIMTRI